MNSKQFFHSCDSSRQWKYVLSQYSNAIEILSDKKKKPDLIELDQFWRETYPAEVSHRGLSSPNFITLDEISKIMTWKITRGKFRPLQKLVDSNKADDVVSTSQAAFLLMSDQVVDIGSKTQGASKTNCAKCKNVIETLMKLKAIGPATASAILAPLYPQYFPFMSDEALLASEEDVAGKKEYTMKSYLQFQERMINKARTLGFKKSSHIVYFLQR